MKNDKQLLYQVAVRAYWGESGELAYSVRVTPGSVEVYAVSLCETESDALRASVNDCSATRYSMTYATVVGTESATEHVFLANSRRISGAVVGVYEPPHTRCGALTPGLGALCRLQRLVPLWGDSCADCSWEYDPAPNTRHNECGSSVAPVFATVPYLQAIFRN